MFNSLLFLLCVLLALESLWAAFFKEMLGSGLLLMIVIPIVISTKISKVQIIVVACFTDNVDRNGRFDFLFSNSRLDPLNIRIEGVIQKIVFDLKIVHYLLKKSKL